MENAARARQLVASLESGEGRRGVLREAREFLNTFQRCHGRLCVAMVTGWREEEAVEGCRELLHALGPGPALIAIHTAVSGARLPAARWLCGEVCYLLPQLSHIFFSLCHSPLTTSHPHPLTPSQEGLVGVLCRLPDLLANRMGRELPSLLLPPHYFTTIGQGLMECLRQVYKALKGSGDYGLVFPATVTGQSVLLGHKDEVLSQLVPELVTLATTDPLWQRVARTFFSRIPTNCLEAVVDGLLRYTMPSLRPPTPLYHLLGNLPVTHLKGQFLFTQKLFLVKVPSSPQVIFTLVGYLSSSNPLRQLLGKALQSALEVWSDGSALRHMDSHQHLWISKLLVLGITCLSDDDLAHLKPTLLKLALAGVQVHINSPLDDVRQIGMAVGESLMNRLHPSLPDKHKLKFDYQPSPEVQALLKLTRAVDVQEAELLKSCDQVLQPPTPPPSRAERCGEGMVQTAGPEDSDSDDDLLPYTMSSDPDASQPAPPCYLRTLLQALLSTNDPLQHESALRAAEHLIQSNPPDLPEVCADLMKVLLHITDTFALPEFTELRLRSMISLASTCPTPSAQYLTTEFYSPNYSIRQRLDILEVLSSAASELATPIPAATPPPAVLRGMKSEKMWEEVVKERLKLKTRIISKGPRAPPPSASPNRFAPVAALFFFPLMARYDHPLNTLDLLGQDSLVLGRLLHTLGTMMRCASHIPSGPAMAAALTDFLWALRYHHSPYVRQGVLFALSMVLAATPSHALWSDVEGTLTEALHWVEDVCENDADSKSRSLAQHTLDLLHATLFEEKVLTPPRVLLIESKDRSKADLTLTSSFTPS